MRLLGPGIGKQPQPDLPQGPKAGTDVIMGGVLISQTRTPVNILGCNPFIGLKVTEDPGKFRLYIYIFRVIERSVQGQ